jgi:hypothetical protein
LHEKENFVCGVGVGYGFDGIADNGGGKRLARFY